ncbi:MAG: glycosyltransferase family 2 protein [Candidatus Buchananbacteria bacterium]
MDLSIIIVSWQVKDILRQCLKSIYDQTKNISFEVIVVDNNSSDGSPAMIKQEFPSVKLIANSDNRGFARANNQGGNIANGDFLIFLNPDTEILDNALGRMVDYLKNNPAVGILGPQLLNTDHTLQPSIRRFPRLRDQLLILSKLPNFFPSLIAGYTAQAFNYKVTQPVEQVMGAALMFRREVKERIGLMDEYFWQYFDEIDFCKLSQEAGWQNWYLAEAKILHHKGTAFSQQRAVFKQYHWNRSLIYYAGKHWPAWQVLVLYLVWPFSMLLAILQQLFKVKKVKPKYL